MNNIVHDFMTHDYITCKMDTPLNEVAKLMIDSGLELVLVVDPIEEINGVISAETILRNYNQDWFGLVAEDIMEWPLVIVSPKALATEAAALMVEKKVRTLVIVHGTPKQPGLPVGIIRDKDIIRELFLMTED